MTHEEFDRHVAQIEESYRDRPGALQGRVVALALIGYLGFFGCYSLGLGLGALFILPAFALPLAESWLLIFIGSVVILLVTASVVRTLWVSLQPPEGHRVTAATAPVLFAMLKSLRGELQVPSFDRVLITGYCNAGVSEVPRLGVLGWPRHYLTLGLPLLESLSADEVRAVLAHEFAHRSRRHARASGWVYRLRRTWEHVFENFRNKPHVAGQVSLRPLINKFIEWFWPRFNAHAFVLSRAFEFEADAVAARVAGTEHVASSLLRVDLYDRLLSEKFWPDLWLEANRSAQPPTDVFLRLRDRLRAPPPAEAPTWLVQSFRWVTNNADTHPCLSARLRSLDRLPPGVERAEYPEWPPVLLPNAAETLLGDSLETVRAAVQVRWEKDCAKHWQERHACAGALQDRLTRLDTAVPVASTEDLWDKAVVLMRLEGDAAAAPLLRELLAARPGHAPANFHLGRHLLAENDDRGIELLERAMAEDEDGVPTACDVLLAYAHRTGRTELIRELKARVDRHQTNLTKSQEERNSVTAADTFIPHGLTAAELEPLLTLLRHDPAVHTADLAQKQMKYFQKQRLFVLCLRMKRPWHGLANRDLEQALVNRLLPSIKLPGRKLVFAPHGSFRALADKLARPPEARIFTRA